MGAQFYPKGVGPNKKEAKQNAAKNFLDAFDGGSIQQNSSVSKTITSNLCFESCDAFYFINQILPKYTVGKATETITRFFYFVVLLGHLRETFKIQMGIPPEADIMNYFYGID